jgi:membrane-bound serine protease (ClpP class)
MNRIYILLFLLFIVPFNSKAQSVISITIDGSINPASASFIHKAIAKAQVENAECLIIHLNTPGGLLKSTRVIVSDILNSKIPVIVYISPGGAHAGSAGVFLTMAAHIAVMAPGTNIGAAHPVSVLNPLDSVMNDKATNDAAAFIRTIAEKRKRNLEWAEDAVRNSVSITEDEALAKHVVDLIAENDRDLLEKLEGKKIGSGATAKILSTKNASVLPYQMTLLDKFLDLISDPNIAYILMMLGFYGLIFELYSPGAIFPGIVGVICLILAFYAMHSLPINYAGLALIIFGIILLLLEIKIISHGMLAIGGIFSLVLGSVFLFQTGSALEFIKVSWSVILSTTGISALFFLFVISMGLKAQRLRPISGIEGIIGTEGETITKLNPSGTIAIHGEMWNAESVTGEIDKNQKIKVVGIKDLKLYVEQNQI